MYFINYFYVTVTDAAPKCPRAESPASSWPCAELSQRRVGGAELAAPNWHRRIGGTELSHFGEITPICVLGNLQTRENILEETICYS